MTLTEQAAQIVKEAHTAATVEMTAAREAFLAEINKPGNEAALERTKRICGNAMLEPAYCGFAWVIVPRKLNPEFIKALKGVKGETRRDYGAPTGYSVKGQCTPTDWQFHCPGEYHGQSMEIKEAGARAFAQTLTLRGLQGVRVYTRAD